MRDIFVIGSGGVGKEAVKIIEEMNKKSQIWNMKGFIDDNENNWGKEINGYKIVGGLEYLKKNHSTRSIKTASKALETVLSKSLNKNMNEDLMNEIVRDLDIEIEKRNKNKRVKGTSYVFVAIANYEVKKRIVQELKDYFEFATLIHPEANIPSEIEIGEGSIIYPGVIMTTNIEIGKHVIISPKCGIGHDTVIKDYVSLLWNANISGYTVIEEGVLIGSGATIIQNKNIGTGAIIGAGAVVVKDVEPGTTNVGVPAVAIDKCSEKDSRQDTIKGIEIGSINEKAITAIR